MKFRLFQFKWYSVIFVTSILFSIVIGKPFELLLFFICYATLRYAYPKTYHSKNFYQCVILSISMMCASLHVIVGLQFSLLFSIPIGILVGYILYKIKDYEDLKELNTKRNTFNIETCSLKELLKQCELKKLGKYNTDVAVKMFIDKLDTKELSKILCIEPQSVSNKKTRLKNKLVK